MQDKTRDPIGPVVLPHRSQSVRHSAAYLPPAATATQSVTTVTGCSPSVLGSALLTARTPAMRRASNSAVQRHENVIVP